MTTTQQSREVAPGPKIITESPQLERIVEIATKVADKDVPVLILGESGVGKEVLARHLHHASRRRDRPFVKVNCTAVPHELVESELFGHERGAFTGATRQTQGKFEQAADGTILLDEIGDMQPYAQAKLLHVLQDRQFTRVGGKEVIDVRARVIATTNRRLVDEIAAGGFREDLYFRLAVILLEIPPLRHRKEDIPVLLDHFMEKYSVEYDSSAEELPPNLLDALVAHDWPGNVRELENVVRRYVLLPDEGHAMSELHTTAALGHQRNGAGSTGHIEALDNDETSLLEIGAEAAEEAEKQVVLTMLERTNWNRKEAAQRLNVCYKTLLNKLNKWELGRSNGNGDAAASGHGAASPNGNGHPDAGTGAADGTSRRAPDGEQESHGSSLGRDEAGQRSDAARPPS